jgi:hypothetical protein
VKRERNGHPTDRDAERARWVAKYRASGLGLERFARRHGLRPGRLHYWVYQSSKGAESTVPLPTFQEVRLPAVVATPGSWTAEVGLPNGTTVRLGRQTDLGWTTALIDCLRGPCSP